MLLKALPIQGTKLMDGELWERVPAQHALGEQFLPLLQELVARLRRFRDTPLLEDLDSQGIAQACLHSVLSAIPEREQGPLRNWETTRTALEALILSVLPEQPGQPEVSAQQPETTASQGPASPGPAAAAKHGANTSVALAAWLDRCHQALAEVHPKAFDLLGLCLEGYTPRDLAGRFGLGLRQVQRILGDLRLAWEKRNRG